MNNFRSKLKLIIKDLINGLDEISTLRKSSKCDQDECKNFFLFCFNFKNITLLCSGIEIKTIHLLLKKRLPSLPYSEKNCIQQNRMEQRKIF